MRVYSVTKKIAILLGFLCIMGVVGTLEYMEESLPLENYMKTDIFEQCEDCHK